MSRSTALLNDHLQHLGEQLVVVRLYRETTDKPYVKTALTFVEDDTQEAIAKTASRLRQLGQQPTGHLFNKALMAQVKRSHRDRILVEKLQFVWRSLKQQLDWYLTHAKTFRDDADSQAMLVALAEQTRVRLERWENLMDEMKVSPGG